MNQPALQIRGLTLRIENSVRAFDAVRDVSFEVDRGETFAIVGESGSGKSLTALSITRLLPAQSIRQVAGSIIFNGANLSQIPECELGRLRGDRIGMVFQEPMTSLNPSMRVGQQVAESLEIHRNMSRPNALARAEELFRKVRISDPARRITEYPHRMSGGMRQRVMIALALACDPDLIIADEPTTALDVTTQSQILSLFRDLQRETGTAVILITHDLAVVAENAHRVAVMYAGEFVEEAPVRELFSDALHPYTQGLIASIPRVGRRHGVARRAPLPEIQGAVPPLWALPQGCTFAPRCPGATERCKKERPPLRAIGQNRRVACFHTNHEVE
jgi:oligopeptide/dipeptide ABC transporter ATP-binding protein